MSIEGPEQQRLVPLLTPNTELALSRFGEPIRRVVDASLLIGSEPFVRRLLEQRDRSGEV
jgi:hypothetical protein